MAVLAAVAVVAAVLRVAILTRGSDIDKAQVVKLFSEAYHSVGFVFIRPGVIDLLLGAEALAGHDDGLGHVPAGAGGGCDQQACNQGGGRKNL